jgi:hypothetical protein
MCFNKSDTYSTIFLTKNIILNEKNNCQLPKLEGISVARCGAAYENEAAWRSGHRIRLRNRPGSNPARVKGFQGEHSNQVA